MRRSPPTRGATGTLGDFYCRTYARVALLPYLGGTIVHLVRLVRGDAVIRFPDEVDYVVVFLGGYAGWVSCCS
jgi:hypothetical protein